MSPAEKGWQQFTQLLTQAVANNHQDELLHLLLTPDEREALATRVKIIEELMRDQLSQRQLKELLGVGIATITRGSHGLKSTSAPFKAWLTQQLLADSTGEAQ